METIKDIRMKPYDINKGYCQEFAEDVAKKIPTAEVWETIFESPAPLHLFLKIGDKFYDAETIDGVNNYQDLPIFKRTGIRKGQKIAERI